VSYKTKFIAYPIAVAVWKYIDAVMDAGALVGDLGENDLDPRLLPVVAAVHNILAGGSVKIEILEKGIESKVKYLDDLLAEATEEANRLNHDAGFYLSLAP
jgi:hypothetical protein